MIKISLHKLLFFSYHGVHEEEKILGGHYEVNVDLFFEETTGVINKLEQSIDYTEAYQIIEQRMKQPTPLLETISMELAALLKKQFPVTKETEVRIKKKNPPVLSFTGEVEVSYRKKYT